MEDKLIEFKRFPKDKQEQVRQFVAYAQMCGLSGADIHLNLLDESNDATLAE